MADSSSNLLILIIIVQLYHDDFPQHTLIGMNSFTSQTCSQQIECGRFNMRKTLRQMAGTLL